ncbi:unnamed protein product [Lampetra planeri]
MSVPRAARRTNGCGRTLPLLLVGQLEDTRLMSDEALLIGPSSALLKTDADRGAPPTPSGVSLLALIESRPRLTVAGAACSPRAHGRLSLTAPRRWMGPWAMRQRQREKPSYSGGLTMAHGGTCPTLLLLCGIRTEEEDDDRHLFLQ